MTGDAEIDALNLQSDVAQKALALKRAAPGVVFTSGRRTLERQASAMASNTVEDRNYVRETYAESPAKDSLVAWLDAHPNAQTQSAIASGFLGVLQSLPPHEQIKISLHLTGRAFDIKPHSAPISAVQALGPTKFLTHEGGLVRWHVQF